MVLDMLRAGLFGALQGLTEFWPVSSSGHLILLHAILPDPLLDRLAFDVALHLGTLAATVWFFRQDLRQIAGALVRVLVGQGKGSTEERLGVALVVGTVPTILLALLLEPFAEGRFRQVGLVGTLLLAGGVLFLIIERVARRRREMETIRWQDALLIGLLQGVAVIPGVSRSGISIIAGLGVGLKREAAARFSFLLSVPVIAAAGVFEVGKYLQSGPRAADVSVFLVGLLVSAAVGLAALRFLMRFLSHGSLVPFGIYRIVLGILVLFMFLFF